MEKTCPRCYQIFECRHDDPLSCDCISVPLSQEQRDYLARHYKDCLCGNCLQEICDTVKSPDIQDLSNFLLGFTATLMSVGTHTSRVERNVARIAESFKYRAEIVIFQRHITLNLLRNDDDTIRRTSVHTVRPGAFNFTTISDLSSLSWKAHDDHLTLQELREEYERIIAKPRLPRWLVPILVAIGNAAFCSVFGGDLWAMGMVLIATLLGFTIRQELTARHVDPMAVFLLTSFVASLIASFGVWFSLGETPHIALATSVLFLTPGVPLINSILDLLEGHVLMGISRGVHAISLIICIVLGLSATLMILGNNALGI